MKDKIEITKTEDEVRVKGQLSISQEAVLKSFARGDKLKAFSNSWKKYIASNKKRYAVGTEIGIAKEDTKAGEEVEIELK